MRFSMWTYPWDVLDLSADRVTAELQEIGCNSLSLATSYHAGRFLQPRSPRRKSYYPEDGTIYFRPSPELWVERRIRPEVASVVSEGDVLADLVRRRDDGGLSVSCWTVCLHNTRLGMLHPQAVMRDAFGDPSYYGLCPSHPDARAYVTTLVRDLAENYRPDVIELESPCFMGFEHGYHHEKDGVGLAPEEAFLLSLCFCPACTARAARAGVDAEKARRTVAKWIGDVCGRAVPGPHLEGFPEKGPDAFRAFPELHEFLLWRFEPVTSLVADIKAEAGPGTRVYLIDLKDGWLGGCDIAAAGRACDGLILCGYDMQPEQVAGLMAEGRGAVGPDGFLGTGFRLFYPEMKGAADLVARCEAAAGAGAESINFYNYGLVPAARLDWARQAVEAAIRF